MMHLRIEFSSSSFTTHPICLNVLMFFSLLSEASCASFEVSSTSADNSAVVKFVSSKFMSSISISLSSENTISSAFSSDSITG